MSINVIINKVAHQFVIKMKRGRFKIQKVDVSTQTSSKGRQLGDQPKVVLEKLNDTKLSTASNLETIFPTHKKCSSPVKLSKPVILRAPRCYRTFLGTLSSEGHANSTLLSNIAHEPQVTHNLRGKTKRVHFTKPGPLCSKNGSPEEEEEEEDLRRPAMLNQSFYEEDEVNGSINFNLDTIAEEPTNLNKTISPQINIISNVTLKDAVDQNSNLEIATETVSVGIEARSGASENVTPKGTNKDLDPKRIKLQFEGVTMVVSAASKTFNGSENRNKSSTKIDDSDSSESFFRSGKEYISIKAKNVHIHNHFYK